ncbi:lipase family protein [Thalassiella azotivora]
MRHRPAFRPLRHRPALALVATGVAVAVAGSAAPASAADTADVPHGVTTEVAQTAPAVDEDFYAPPAALTGAPGDVVRSEPMPFYVDPLRLVRADATAHRVMYVSTDRTGERIAVTGTVLTPNRAWTGPGERPVIGYGVGTQGLGDHCAPSRLFAAGSDYEGVFVKGLLDRGWGVAVTDYQGLGTPGLHTYVSREVTGNALLDVVRAAQRLPEASLPDAGPVGLTGYSQGGAAAASAVELAPTYAPELALKGAVAGAPPADLGPVGRNLDGSLYFGFLGYALAGLAESYDVDTDPYLNDRGRRVLDELRESCVGDAVLGYGFTRSSTLTADGRPVTQVMEEEPFASVMADNVIGERRPTAPVLVTHSVLDDVIPYEVGRGLAQRWCRQGATVRLGTNAAPGHVGGMLRSYPEAFAFLEARFAGHRALSSCWRL